MHDLRFAFRQLCKFPGFSFVAIATLALGIGLNTSMFSLMNLLILRPVPFPDRDQVVRVYRTTSQNPTADHSAVASLDLRRETNGFIDLASYRLWGYTLTQPGRSPENLNGLRVSGNFFSVLGLQPELGRWFTPADDQAGNQVAIISHAAWQTNFGGDPSVIGRVVSMDEQPTTIIGVMPEAFSSIFLWGPGDVFRPLGLAEAEKTNRDDTSYRLLGRFGKSMTMEQLNARLQAAAIQLAPSRPRDQSEDGLRAVTLQSTTVPPGTTPLTVLLMGLSGFVLLIVCGNLANLQLSRALSRSREFAIRTALGASRVHLLRPLLLESILLSLFGGLLGILVTLWGNEWISKSLSASLPVNFNLTVDWHVLVFALVLSLLTGVVFGLTPALLSSRVRVNDSLKGGGRGTTGDRSQHFFRNSLIVLQFAAALVLLSSTGFFISGMRTLMQRDPGWTPAGITQCILNLPPGRYGTPDQINGFFNQLDERLRALPGVSNVAIGWTAPLYQLLTSRTFVVEGREPPPPGKEPVAFVNAVSPSYLTALKIRLVSGRQLAATDTLTTVPVVLLNESMARALFPGQDAVGHRLATGEGAGRTSAEIVGVFADVSMAGNPAPQPIKFQVFKPLAQEPWTYVTVMIRSELAAMTEPLRRTVNQLDPTIPVQMRNTAEELAKVSTRGLELITRIFMAFSLLGLFLAALGLYGVIMRLVMMRTAEIGVRIALGAQANTILRLILGTGIRLSLLGAGAGLLGSIGMNVLMGVMFNNGTVALDYFTLAMTTLVLVLVALVACYLPARRATKIDPMAALRAE